MWRFFINKQNIQPCFNQEKHCALSIVIGIETELLISEPNSHPHAQ
jgi:hypothetical protein